MSLRKLSTIVLLVAFINPMEVEALEPTTPYQYWKDYCGYPDVIPNIYEIPGGSLTRLLSAQATLVRYSANPSQSQIVRRTDDPNFWRLTRTEDNANWPGTTKSIIGQIPFPTDEMRLATNGRSGYLIAPDIIATASHSPGLNPLDFAVVFNLSSKKDPVTHQCIPPDPDYIPDSDVYFPRPAAPLIANTFSDPELRAAGVDYAAFYLNRAVIGHQYLRIRKDGVASGNDTLAMIGNPFLLRSKLQFGATYAGDKVNISRPAIKFPTFRNFYIAPGASGSPMYNLDRNFVESSIGTVVGLGCLGTLDITVPTESKVLRDLCDDIADEFGEVRHDVNNGPISILAGLVPTPYLRVDPLDDVTYILPVDGMPAPTSTSYTAVASSSEVANTSISASIAPNSVPGEPNFLSLSSYSSSLAPGTSTTITASATVPTGTTCGVYDRYVVVVDQTHGFRDRMLHRFEIGMTDFSVSPDEVTDIYGITYPSSPEIVTYTLTNTRPTAVVVEVTLGQSWLSFDTGSSSLINLAPAGQPGATKAVSVKPNASAFSLASGDYPFSVSFHGKGGCARYEPVQRFGIFHKGGLVLLKRNLSYPVFPPTSPADPVTDTFNISSDFCVSDIKVRFNSHMTGEVVGIPLVQWVPRLRIYLDFVGDHAISSQIWDLNQLPTGWVVPTYESDNEEITETLLMGRTQNVPPTGAGSLSTFVNKSSSGQWSFRLYDDGVNASRNGILLSWELELKGSPRCLGGGGQ